MVFLWSSNSVATSSAMLLAHSAWLNTGRKHKTVIHNGIILRMKKCISTLRYLELQKLRSTAKVVLQETTIDDEALYIVGKGIFSDFLQLSIQGCELFG